MGRPEARCTGPRKGPDLECQRGVLGYRFCRSARHTHSPASQSRQPTPGGVNQYQGHRSESIPRAACQRLPNPRATRTRTRRKITAPWIKNAFSWDFHSPKMIKTHIKNVRGLTKKDQTFASATFHRFPSCWKFPRETPWKIAENRTLKWGSSPPEQIVRIHSTFKWLKFNHLRHKPFYAKNVIHMGQL